jgi:hypothetical protein
MTDEARETSNGVGSAGGEAPAATPGSGGRGIFDHLTDIILQGQAARPGSAPVGAAAAEERRAVPRAVHIGAAEGTDPFAGRRQTFLFRETAEKLVIEKEVYVREEVVVSDLIEEHIRKTTPARSVVAIEDEAPSAPAPVEMRSEAPVDAPPPAEAPTDAPPQAPPPPQPEAMAPTAAPAAATPAPEPEAPRLVFGGPEDAAARASEQPRLVFGGPEDSAARPLKRPGPQAVRSAPADAPGRSASLRWLWYLLLFCLAGLIAFYGGQLLGTLWAGSD